MSVRERIKAIQVKLRDGALTPDMARESLVTLTALLGNVGDEVRASDGLYRMVLMKCLDEEGKANRARMRAETSQEFTRAQEAKGTERLVVEMIRSCRAYLRSLDTEISLSR